MNGQAQKPPRQWAAEITAMPKLEDRRAALAKVPSDLRPIVETHIKNFWLWKKSNEARRN